MFANLKNPIFNDETKAREALEAVRWPDGPTCPHCGAVDKITRLHGKSHRPGLCYCNHCTGHFTVTVGTVFERSHVPLTKWWLAVYLLSSSKKGMSSHQVHRMLGVTYKTAWFMTHRIREAMREMNPGPLGGEGKTVEADEAFIGTKKGTRINKRGPAHKHKVVTLVEREGSARSFHVADFGFDKMRKLLVTNIDRKSKLMTDEARHYRGAGKEFAKHEHVEHSADEYVRGDAHTNTVEGFYSIFKRGMKGVYQHCGEKHLHRYVAEFDFRYNNRSAMGVEDAERATKALQGISGKRLTYRAAD
jgi:transposase-like protein